MRRGFALRKKVFLKVLPIVFVFYTLVYVWPQFHVKRSKSDERDAGDDAQTSDFVYDSIDTLPFDLRTLRDLIEAKNREAAIANVNKFGALQPNDTVIVIQVHNRVRYLNSLIESLRNVREIEKVLLIFSHDFYDLRLNEVIKSINFSKVHYLFFQFALFVSITCFYCQVLQIFYPHSLQLHPNEFPGPDPNDCPRNIKKDEAILLNCINARDSDTYGHYREAKYTQTKHHWFWKINFVFDILPVTRNHTGYFIFVEEDHYFAPDSLHVFNLMKTIQAQHCSRCDVLTLGAYSKAINYGIQGDKVEIAKWSSSKHNMGFAFNRQTWDKIKTCAKNFCEYDDYNWDWSLQHISLKCLKDPLITITVVSPRIFHVGECGVHHRGKDCMENKLVHQVKHIIERSSKYFYPSRLSIQKPMKRIYKMSKANGGWADKRDHSLCLRHMKSS
ncbi:alpha-1:6-mannosyl-glycoprotein 2-beta-N-acetylglucosaminyltransferase-like protein [Dinothrombium tinctorium]|uniref:Alpha-1,6-mannosyl-glycoprotein 2-beta-N-acetylglucosaminyltransferase n=1 Tax=Dinothrombium tinctorium TaxID=1965070 RepID=A0A3S3PHN5_9ACAR|nr:alpha-1:6-mannosyl-glycoprotein 2-beta-N-acetylglucosaminyltransferase-like protein [Dinothrombium tinctorium]